MVQRNSDIELFRVWDKRSKIFLRQPVFLCASGLLYKDGDRYGIQMDSSRRIHPYPESEVILFTGLKSKEGIPIYDDYILNWNGKIVHVKYESDRGGFICEWSPSKNQHYTELTCDVAIESTVIGNIYEQPDLLNQLWKG